MKRRDAGKETWHRLLEWDNDSAAAERLSALVLQLEGFKVDPSHPRGGRDGIKDLIILKGDKKWIAAAHFPRGQKRFSEIRKKFLDDSKGVKSNEASGFVFIVNQEIKLSERKELEKKVAYQENPSRFCFHCNKYELNPGPCQG